MRLRLHALARLAQGILDMSNEEQREELFSLQCIYEGSKDVRLQVWNPGEDDVTEHMLEVSVVVHRPQRVQMKIILPAQYLVEDEVLPSYELSSESFTAESLRVLCEHLDGMKDAPVLFSWIEWLRGEGFDALQRAYPKPIPKAIQNSTPYMIELVENDIPSDPLESRPCTNCSGHVHAVTQIVGCGHLLCRKCVSTTWQVYSASGATPVCCPLPGCRATAPEVAQVQMPELWMTVSEHILSTRFKEPCFP